MVVKSLEVFAMRSYRDKCGLGILGLSVFVAAGVSMLGGQGGECTGYSAGGR